MEDRPKYKFVRGSLVYEICTTFQEGRTEPEDIRMFVIQAKVSQSYKLTRVVTTSLSPFCGIKLDAFGQFNQSFRDSYIRGNHLHMYRTYTSEAMLEKDIEIFKKRYRKRSGMNFWSWTLVVIDE